MNRRYGDCSVYFVRRADGEGPIKIGCSEHPEGRLAALMCWSPYPLAILATVPGDEELERRFHARFAEQHSHREWFHATPELVWTVYLVARGQFDISTLPEGFRLGSGMPKPRSPASKARYDAWIKIRRLKRQGINVPERIWDAVNGCTYKASQAELQARADIGRAYLATLAEQASAA